MRKLIMNRIKNNTISIYQILPNKVAYYVVRKCGYSTIALWIDVLNNNEVYEKIKELSKIKNQSISEFKINDRSSIELETIIRQKNTPKKFAHLIISETKVENLKMERFCVVRDPVERFYSAYTHLVYRKLVFGEHISIEKFIEGIENNYDSDAWKVVRLHTSPLISCIGKSPEKFSKIYNLSQLPELKMFLEQRSGKELPSVHINSNDVYLSKKTHEIPKINDNQLDWIKNYYSEDYNIYGKWM
jgi:hypothetical protein